ncbi:MAG: Integral rane protein [Verrucomicrobia bacterium]|nr:Integral rane protein [Verrucomicrobiota bacterium]
MITGVLLALLASLVYGFLGVTFEAAAKRNYAPWDFIFWKQLCGTILIFVIVAVRGDPLYRPDVLALGAIGALSYVLTCVCYLIASRERDISANWTILNMSVLVPLSVSILWFGDKFTGTKAIGALLTLGAIVLIGGKPKVSGMTGASKWASFIFGAFLLNGVLSALFRWVPDGCSFLFVAYFYAVSCLMALPFKLRRKITVTPTKGLLAWGAAGAFSHCTGMLLTIAALTVVGKVSQQAGVVVFPITNGFVIPLGVVLGAIILGQKIPARNKAGVGLGMAGLVLLSLPDDFWHNLALPS